MLQLFLLCMLSFVFNQAWYQHTVMEEVIVTNASTYDGEREHVVSMRSYISSLDYGNFCNTKKCLKTNHQIFYQQKFVILQ
jgi:hypothetical protein